MRRASNTKVKDQSKQTRKSGDRDNAGNRRKLQLASHRRGDTLSNTKHKGLFKKEQEREPDVLQHDKENKKPSIEKLKGKYFKKQQKTSWEIEQKRGKL